MGERRGTRGLELWCKRMTEGYPGVKVENMTTSWRDGLAFCAIIHHFRPDLIDFSKLKKEDIYYNNDLAFRVAKQYLGIPALLEPQDMVECPVPDRLCILTYLSQFYQAFGVSKGSNERIPSKRPVQSSPDHGMVSPVSTSPPTKVAHIGAGRIRREPCAKCKLPVFIAERLNVGKSLYHRTCFRCARCDSQLTPANYYETENNEFCCEICPDEEKSMNEHAKEKLLQRALSDEEKTASLKNFSSCLDDYSSVCETALEDLQSEPSQFASARSKFFQTQLDSPSDSGAEVEPPDLPDTAPPDLAATECASARVDSGFPSVNSTVRLSVDVTKDKSADEEKSDTSLVRARMRLFESNDKPTKSDLHRVSKSVELKPAVPIAKLDEISNFDDQFDNNQDNIKDAIGKMADEKLDEGAQEVVEGSDEASTSNEPLPLITNENKIGENIQDGNKEAIKSLDDAVGDLMALVRDDDQNASVDNEAYSEDSVVVIDEDPSESNTEAKVNPVPDDELENIDVNVDESKLVLDITGSSLCKHDEDPSESKTETKENPVPDHELENIDVNVDESKIVLDSTGSSLYNPDTSVLVVESSPEIILIEDSPNSLKEASGTMSDTPNEGQDENHPTSRNPFDDDSDEDSSRAGSSYRSREKNYPDQLNPFGDEDDEEEEVELRTVPAKPLPSPRFKKKLVSVEYLSPLKVDTQRISINTYDNREGRRVTKPSATHTRSLQIEGYKNPFDSDDDEEDRGVYQPRPVARRKKVEANPDISLIEHEDRHGETSRVPVPTPRLSRTTPPALEPEHKEPGGLSVSTRINYGSNSSISSGSMFGSARKKKPAPRPPILPRNDDSTPHSLTSSPSHSMQPSPRSTPKHRKAKKAPPPPSSTPIPPTRNLEAPVSDSVDISALRASTLTTMSFSMSNLNVESSTDGRGVEKEKIDKDQENRNKQNQNIHVPNVVYDDPHSLPAPNKSTYGKWKRKKDQAPGLPIPQKRTIKALSMAEVKRELDLIEKQQQGLEKQGVRLEQIIREKCEGEGEKAVANADDIPIEVEDLILQLFELVNEKNELFRKQAELMYLRRQQRLEEEHADVEYQIRCLMALPENKKTDSDKTREEELIKRLVDIVERRSDIIDCLEKDRIREAEEDDSINCHINLFTSKREEEETQKSTSKKDKKKEEKKKKKHEKKSKDKDKLDVDKDIDESESNCATMEKKKKKFKLNIF